MICFYSISRFSTSWQLILEGLIGPHWIQWIPTRRLEASLGVKAWPLFLLSSEWVGSSGGWKTRDLKNEVQNGSRWFKLILFFVGHLLKIENKLPILLKFFIIEWLENSDVYKVKFHQRQAQKSEGPICSSQLLLILVQQLNSMVFAWGEVEWIWMNRIAIQQQRPPNHFPLLTKEYMEVSKVTGVHRNHAF